jgi:hypothetical protein
LSAERTPFGQFAPTGDPGTEPVDAFHALDVQNIRQVSWLAKGALARATEQGGLTLSHRVSVGRRDRSHSNWGESRARARLRRSAGVCAPPRARSLAPGSVDLLITDPPYESLEKHRAIGTTTRLKHSKASRNDWFTIFPNARFPELFEAAYRALKRDAHLVFCDAETKFVAKPIGEAAGFKFRKAIPERVDRRRQWAVVLRRDFLRSSAGR